MANRRKNFPTIKDGVRYTFGKMGGKNVLVMAESDDGSDNPPISSAVFEHDPTTNMFLVKGGTLDLHPEHKSLGVGPMMGKMVNQRYLRHIPNWKE